MYLLSDNFTVGFPFADVALKTIENGSNVELFDNPLKSLVKSVPQPNPTLISLENLCASKLFFQYLNHLKISKVSFLYLLPFFSTN